MCIQRAWRHAKAQPTRAHAARRIQALQRGRSTRARLLRHIEQSRAVMRIMHAWRQHKAWASYLNSPCATKICLHDASEHRICPSGDVHCLHCEGRKLCPSCGCGSVGFVKWGMRRLWAADGTARSADGRDVLSVHDVRRRGFDRDDMEAEFFEVSDLSVDENTSSAPAFTFSGR
jgi:hypothetical protein